MTDQQKEKIFDEVLEREVETDDGRFHFDDWMKGLKIASALWFAEMCDEEVKKTKDAKLGETVVLETGSEASR